MMPSVALLKISQVEWWHSLLTEFIKYATNLQAYAMKSTNADESS